MHDSEEIGSRLRDERKRRNLTQDQAASQFGIAKRTQANYEAGASDATAVYLSKAWVGGFDVEYILTGNRAVTPMDSLTSDERQVLEQFRLIQDVDRQAIQRFLQAMADDVKSSK